MATTGMAVSVLDVGAQTIHSFLGTFDLARSNYHAAWNVSKNVAGVVSNLGSLRVFILDEGQSELFLQSSRLWD